MKFITESVLLIWLSYFTHQVSSQGNIFNTPTVPCPNECILLLCANKNIGNYSPLRYKTRCGTCWSYVLQYKQMSYTSTKSVVRLTKTCDRTCVVDLVSMSSGNIALYKQDVQRCSRCWYSIYHSVERTQLISMQKVQKIVNSLQKRFPVPDMRYRPGLDQNSASESSHEILIDNTGKGGSKKGLLIEINTDEKKGYKDSQMDFEHPGMDSSNIDDWSNDRTHQPISHISSHYEKYENHIVGSHNEEPHQINNWHQNEVNNIVTNMGHTTVGGSTVASGTHTIGNTNHHVNNIVSTLGHTAVGGSSIVSAAGSQHIGLTHTTGNINHHVNNMVSTLGHTTVGGSTVISGATSHHLTHTTGNTNHHVNNMVSTLGHTTAGGSTVVSGATSQHIGSTQITGNTNHHVNNMVSTLGHTTAGGSTVVSGATSQHIGSTQITGNTNHHVNNMVSTMGHTTVGGSNIVSGVTSQHMGATHTTGNTNHHVSNMVSTMGHTTVGGSSIVSGATSQHIGATQISGNTNNQVSNMASTMSQTTVGGSTVSSGSTSHHITGNTNNQVNNFASTMGHTIVGGSTVVSGSTSQHIGATHLTENTNHHVSTLEHKTVGEENINEETRHIEGNIEGSIHKHENTIGESVTHEEQMHEIMEHGTADTANEVTGGEGSFSETVGTVRVGEGEGESINHQEEEELENIGESTGDHSKVVENVEESTVENLHHDRTEESQITLEENYQKIESMLEETLSIASRIDSQFIQTSTVRRENTAKTNSDISCFCKVKSVSGFVTAKVVNENEFNLMQNSSLLLQERTDKVSGGAAFPTPKVEPSTSITEERRFNFQFVIVSQILKYKSVLTNILGESCFIKMIKSIMNVVKSILQKITGLRQLESCNISKFGTEYKFVQTNILPRISRCMVENMHDMIQDLFFVYKHNSETSSYTMSHKFITWFSRKVSFCESEYLERINEKEVSCGMTNIFNF